MPATGLPAEGAIAPVTFSADRDVLANGIAKIDKELRICTSVSEIPFAAWREALLKGADLKACEVAARSLVDMRNNHFDEYRMFLSGQNMNGQHANALHSLFTDYKEQCLQMLDDYSRSTIFGKLFGDKFDVALHKNVGSLFGRNTTTGKSFRCTASVIRFRNNKEDSLALATAGHCIGTYRPMGIGNQQIVSVLDDIQFRTLDGSTMQVRLDEDVVGISLPIGSDLAIIPMKSNGNEHHLEGLVVADPSEITAWEPLYLIGVNPVAMALRRADGVGTEQAARESASISLGTPCRVHGVSNGELLHNCETEMEMSGSPIFMIRSDGPALVAIHTGGGTRLKSLETCGAGSVGAYNYGVLLPRNADER